MATKRKPKGLSIDKGQFVKAVGYVQSKSGKVQARRWYLGAVDDGADAALTKAEQLRQAWRDGRGTAEIERDGERVRVWVVDDPLRFAGSAAAPMQSAADVPAVDAPALTVEQAATRYLAGIEQRYRAGQVSHAYWASETFNLQRGVELLGKQTPLASVGAAELTAAVLTLAARPLAKPRAGQKSDPIPISVKSARTYLASLRYFLDEMSKTETTAGSNQPLWVKPLRFDDIFRDNQPKPTPAELDAMLAENGSGAEADAFTVDELAKLYGRASERQRLWICLALNCGFANAELNTLTVAQCVGLGTDAAKIRRFRGKTQIYAEWTLWKETADLLRWSIEKDKRQEPTDRAILTADRRPLIEPRGMGRRDAVRSAWENIVAVLPEDRRLPFKYLRKSGARLIRHMPNVGGDDVAEMFLSHADDKHGVLKAYSGRAWGKLTAALVELRKQLQPMFDAYPDHALDMRLWDARKDRAAMKTIIDQAFREFQDDQSAAEKAHFSAKRTEKFNRCLVTPTSAQPLSDARGFVLGLASGRGSRDVPLGFVGGTSTNAVEARGYGWARLVWFPSERRLPIALTVMEARL